MYDNFIKGVTQVGCNAIITRQLLSHVAQLAPQEYIIIKAIHKASKEIPYVLRIDVFDFNS